MLTKREKINIEKTIDIRYRLFFDTIINIFISKKYRYRKISIPSKIFRYDILKNIDDISFRSDPYNLHAKTICL